MTTAAEGSTTEWFVFLPQAHLTIDAIVTRAQAAERSGFDGIAFFDHLEMPGAAKQDVWEAFGIATWVAAHTQRLRIGHLVLCDAFRHPAVLAKQAVTLAAASGGRFELGLGTGSWMPEFARYRIPDGHDTPARFRRLALTLETIAECWGMNPESDAIQHPLPPHPIPLVIGGTGAKTLKLVRDHAHWWNVPTHQLHRLPELRSHAGTARVSVQQLVGFIPAGADRQRVIEASTRRFGHLGAGLICGNAAELRAHFQALTAQGAQRIYTWFADFAAPDTLAEFAETVIREF